MDYDFDRHPAGEPVWVSAPVSLLCSTWKLCPYTCPDPISSPVQDTCKHSIAMRLKLQTDIQCYLLTLSKYGLKVGKGLKYHLIPTVFSDL